MDSTESQTHEISTMMKHHNESPWTLFDHSELQRPRIYAPDGWVSATRLSMVSNYPYSPPRGCTRSLPIPPPIPLANDIPDIILYDGH
ncbi:hypothetical protein Nepgr_017237 [Nepenthes gracilis]|uniref:Uncharacterized protein n=1 Tax=Nepenthes gracilis TaxID=150966 RepID=A0AAD3SS72_NEPGR|nr:hypothetical protein Nepgr_017237 [Nepenthes gracilis]